MGNLGSVPLIFHPPIQSLIDFVQVHIIEKEYMEVVNNGNDDPLSVQTFSEFDRVHEITIDGNNHGYKPMDATKDKQYPLHIWIQGTYKNPWKFDDKIFTNYMANKGFVSISLNYDYKSYPLFCESMTKKAKTLFDETDPNSKISKFCAESFVDCSQGIVISGHSQGAQLALLASNYIKHKWKVKGVLALNGGYKLDGPIPFGVYSVFECLKYDQLKLNIDKTRIRATGPRWDKMFGNTVQDQMEIMTGYNNNDNLNGLQVCNNEFDCIQSDGSGWCIVRDSDITDFYGYGGAGHAWMGRNDKQPKTLDDKFYNGRFCGSLRTTHDWLAGKL